MSDQADVQEKLREVVGLIKAGNPKAAREHLSRLMKMYPENADAYYLASRLTSNPEQREKLLKHTLRLNPQHKQALAQLQTPPPSPPVTAPAEVKPQPKPKINRRILLLAGVVGLVVIAALFVMLRGVVVSSSYILITSEGLATFNNGQFQHFKMQDIKAGELRLSLANWSVDGQRIACMDQQRNLCMVNGDGTDIQMLGQQGWNPFWSPDNQKIAFLGGEVRRPALYVFNSNDGSTVRVSDAFVDESYFVWSRDSTRLAFTDTEANLVIAQADGSGSVKLKHGFTPEWSPDGKRLIMTTFDHKISVADEDGSNRVEIGTGDFPNWSPDGSQIAFTNEHGINIMNHDGSNVRTISKDDNRSIRLEYPTWSPDGQYVAYISTNAIMHQHQIVSADGQNVYTVKNSSNFANMTYHMAWLPSSASGLLPSFIPVASS